MYFKLLLLLKFLLLLFLEKSRQKSVTSQVYFDILGVLLRNMHAFISVHPVLSDKHTQLLFLCINNLIFGDSPSINKYIVMLNDIESEAIRETRRFFASFFLKK